ncbi:MAG: hypothetical protein AAGA23_03470 [Pseudomonadota bacterium]
MRRWFAAAALTLPALVAAQTAVSPQGSVDINLPTVAAGSVGIDPAFVLDVPAGTRSLRIELDGLGNPRDLDLFLRIGSPFPDDINTFNDFSNSADFVSQSLFENESITLGEYSRPDLAGQRIFIGFAAFEGAASAARLTVDASPQPVDQVPIVIDFDNTPNTPNCDTSPWNDTTAFSPVGGNNATTLGEARRNAMREAARLLSQELYGPVMVTIQACWDNLGGSANSAVLAGARGNQLVANTPGLPDNLFFIQAAVTRRAGTSLSGLLGGDQTGTPDIFIEFNADIDGSTALGSRVFYYGLNGAGNTNNDSDFVSVALHEITHGMGFVSTINGDGSLTGSLPDVFTANLIDNRNGEAISLIDSTVGDDQRLDTITSVSGLQWSGPESSISERNLQATSSDAYVVMNAPLTYQPGSSVSHVAQNYCELMTANTSVCVDSPFRQLALSRPMLNEVGWAPGPDRPVYVGLMFDRSRNGHGFELTLGGQDADGNDVYVLTFYSFETLGRAPEWFQAIGTVENGVFSGQRNADRIGFAQFLFDDARTPPQQANPDEPGQVVLNFNRPETLAACNDGVDRSGVANLAVLQFVLSGQVDEWCVEALTLLSSRPASDFGGLWFAGQEDQGWGFTLENIDNGDATTTLFVLLYVYAADGTPVWFFGLETFSSLAGPLEFEMFQRTGFPRLAVNGNLEDEVAGSMSLTLAQPSMDLSAGNRATVNVTYQGAEGGDWVRADVPIQRLSLERTDR